MALLRENKLWIAVGIIALSFVVVSAFIGGDEINLGADTPKISIDSSEKIKDKGTYLEVDTKPKDIESQGEKIKIDKDKPKIDIEGWYGEYTISVEPIFPGNKKPKASKETFSKKVSYTDGDITSFFLLNEDESVFEIDFELKSPPPSNVFEYRITGAENFDFYYQGAITQEELDNPELIFDRPENVVGSYAVYHKTKKHHLKGETNYSTGKVMHIYRPKVYDFAENETWATLGYSNGILSVTVPQEFLDNAVYPVVVDPTFGRTTVGGGYLYSPFDRLHCLGNIAGAAGSVDSIHANMEISGTGVSTTTGLLYTSSDRVLRVTTADDWIVQTGAGAWYSADAASEAVSAIDYDICTAWDDGAGLTGNAYDTGVAGDGHGSTISWPSYPDPYTASDNEYLFSIYVTYTPTDIPAISTLPVTTVGATSATFEGEITDAYSLTDFAIGFEYGISAFSATTTVESASSSIGTYSGPVTGLTALTEYDYRAYASTTDGKYGYGDTFKVYVATISTGTPVASGDNHSWDISDFADGTYATTTTNLTNLLLEEQVSGSGWGATSTESFESVADGTNIDTNSDYQESSDATDPDCWNGESADSPSGSTGATDGSDGTVYAVFETSSSDCYTSGETSYMELDPGLYDSAYGQSSAIVQFDYNMYGSQIGTLTLQASSTDGTWYDIWSISGQQHINGASYTTQEVSLAATTTNFRFKGTAAGGYYGDTSVDYIRFSTSSETTAYEDGYWISPAWDVGSISYVDTSKIEFSSTTPSDTSVVVGVAINSDSANAPTTTTATYYFDASDAGPTDPDSNWTDDANAFDGSTSTSATNATGATENVNELHGEGTNAPASGDEIQQVRLRYYGSSGQPFNSVRATAYTDGLGETLGTVNIQRGPVGEVAQWSSYSVLTEPAAGWTWATVQALEVKFYDSGSNGDSNAYKAEIEVYSTPYTSVTSGDTIPGVTGDLTGKYVWVRADLNASTDAEDTPTFTGLKIGINQGSAPAASETSGQSIIWFQ